MPRKLRLECAGACYHVINRGNYRTHLFGGEWAERKSSPQKVQFAALLKATTSVSNAWFATRQNMGQPASVTQFVRRLRLSGAADERRFRKGLSIVKP